MSCYTSLISVLFYLRRRPAKYTSHRAALARARTTASSIYPLFGSHLPRLDAAIPGQQRHACSADPAAPQASRVAWTSWSAAWSEWEKLWNLAWAGKLGKAIMDCRNVTVLPTAKISTLARKLAPFHQIKIRGKKKCTSVAWRMPGCKLPLTCMSAPDNGRDHGRTLRLRHMFVQSGELRAFLVAAGWYRSCQVKHRGECLYSTLITTLALTSN